MKKKKKKVFHELSEKYRDKATPCCEHFNRCGGCMFQNISYKNQLLLKKEYINNLMKGITSVKQIHPSRPFRYRNRMDIVTAFGKIGLREAGSYKHVVDIHSCKIMQEGSDRLLEKIRPLVKEIEDYNYLTHKGYLRYVIFRESMFTGELMLNFVVASSQNYLEDLIKNLIDDANSISIIKNDGLADLSFGTIVETVKRGYIEESFQKLKFRITPNSFLQSNSEIADTVYRKIKNNTVGRVLDLYSGIGTISLIVSENAESVTGVESSPEAVDSANINKEANKIRNVDFLCDDARNFIRNNKKHFDTLILDPPRSGIHPKMLKYIDTANTKKIIYMSCNPVKFREEMDALKSFELVKFEAFDMFPQTPHIETLAILKKK